MSWAETRQTKRKDDIAHSLLGIFDIYMPLTYGEGMSDIRTSVYAVLPSQIEPYFTPQRAHGFVE